MSVEYQIYNEVCKTVERAFSGNAVDWANTAAKTEAANNCNTKLAEDIESAEGTVGEL